MTSDNVASREKRNEGRINSYLCTYPNPHPTLYLYYEIQDPVVPELVVRTRRYGREGRREGRKKEEGL